MAEPPDFDQIARQLIVLIDFEAFDHIPIDDLDRQAIANRLADVVEQLRQVWNARGAADAKAVQARTVELVTGPVVGAWIARFAETIHALDVETVWQDGQNHARIPHDRDVEIP